MPTLLWCLPSLGRDFHLFNIRTPPYKPLPNPNLWNFSKTTLRLPLSRVEVNFSLNTWLVEGTASALARTQLEPLATLSTKIDAGVESGVQRRCCNMSVWEPMILWALQRPWSLEFNGVNAATLTSNAMPCL